MTCACVRVAAFSRPHFRHATRTRAIRMGRKKMMRAALWSAAVMIGVSVPGVVLAEDKAETTATVETASTPAAKTEVSAPEMKGAEEAAPAASGEAQITTPIETVTETAKAPEPAPATPAAPAAGTAPANPAPARAERVEPEKVAPARVAPVSSAFQASWQDASADEK